MTDSTTSRPARTHESTLRWNQWPQRSEAPTIEVCTSVVARQSGFRSRFRPRMCSRAGQIIIRRRGKSMGSKRRWMCRATALTSRSNHATPPSRTLGLLISLIRWLIRRGTSCNWRIRKCRVWRSLVVARPVGSRRVDLERRSSGTIRVSRTPTNQSKT